MTRRKPVPLVLPRVVSRHPIYDVLVAERGFDLRKDQVDNGIAHARESRKDER